MCSEVSACQISAYRFLKGFLYPATLGGALSWWIQAVATYVHGLETDSEPTGWALWFGLWFIAYHSIWYWFLLSKSQDGDMPPKGYTWRSLLTDVVDTAALMFGLAALGLASGSYDKMHAGWTFFAVMVLILSAAAANYPRWEMTFAEKKDGLKKLSTFPVPFFIAFTIPFIGFVWHLSSGNPGTLATCLLIALFVLLIVYMIAPNIFSSHRGPLGD